MSKKDVKQPTSPESIQGRKGLKRETSPDVPGGNKAQQLEEIKPKK